MAPLEEHSIRDMIVNLSRWCLIDGEKISERWGGVKGINYIGGLRSRKWGMRGGSCMGNSTRVRIPA